MAKTKRFCSWTTCPSDYSSDIEATDVEMHTHPHGKMKLVQHVCQYTYQRWITVLGPISQTIFARNSNSMEISPCCNSVDGHQIATNFCTCHDSKAVVPCTQFCSDHCIRIDARAKRETGPSFDKTMLPCFIDSMASELTVVPYILVPYWYSGQQLLL